MKKTDEPSDKILVSIYIVKDTRYNGTKVYRWNTTVKMGDISVIRDGSNSWRMAAKSNAKYFTRRLIEEIKGKNPDEVYRKEYTIDN